MKKISYYIVITVLTVFSAVTAFSAAEPLDNVLMSANGTLEAGFSYNELMEKGNLLIYENSTTGYRATVNVDKGDKTACTLSFDFSDGDAFFGFKTDMDLNDNKLTLTSIHSKAANLPHRKLVDMEYSSQPYGQVDYNENAKYYYANAGYVSEIREFTRKGIAGQGVTLDVYENGNIHLSRTVLDTDTEGGYDARSAKEIIGSHSREIIVTVVVIGWFLLKNVSMENVKKNSAEINKKETS